MTLLAPDLNLHGAADLVIQQAARTHTGMAFYAGTGPHNTTCAQCLNWQDFGTKKVKARCKKHQEMMHGRAGQEFPGGTASCKYFEVRS